MAFNDSSYGLFQGQLFLATRVMNGAATSGFVAVGDADKFEIQHKQKFEDIKESQTGIGLTSAHIPIDTEVMVKMNILNIKLANWTNAVWGSNSGAVTGATVSGEAITAYNDSIVPLAHPGVSAVTVAGLTLDTDYTVDAANGALVILATSPAVVAGTPVATTVSYTFDSYSGKVEAFTTQQPIFSIRLHGINTANSSQPVVTTCYQWAPNMAAVLNMIEKKHMSFELDGMLLQDSTKPLPSSTNLFSQFYTVQKG